MKFIVLFFMVPILSNAQSIENLIDQYKENYPTDLDVKVLDLDNDSDLDVIFNSYCSESKCLQVYLNIEGEYT